MKKLICLASMILFPLFAMAGTPAPSAPYAQSTIVQHGKVVYSGKINLAYAGTPERFSVTVAKAGKVDNTFNGVTLPGDPMQIGEGTSTGYIAKANAHSVKNGTVTTGKTFTLIALKHDNVQIIGTISWLISMKTRKVHGETIQFPIVHESDINDTVHLAHGQSTVIPVGGYQVKVTRS
ncbi:MAG: hypothetical protein ACYCPA_08510 [Acidithiobacillus sp.]